MAFNLNPSNIFEPKHENMFICDFPDEFCIPSYLVKKISPVKYLCNGGKHRWGHQKWERMTFSLYSPIAPSVDQILFNIVKKNFKEIKKISIQELDRLGEVISEMWIMRSHIIDIDFGKLDWGSADFKEATIKIIPEDIIIKM